MTYEGVYIKHTRKIPFEYNKINENIYIGSNACCRVHFRSSLLKDGVCADISLEEEKIDYPRGVSYFLWLPVKDKMAPTQKQLLIGAKAIRDLINNGVKMYVHCKRGHGRSPTLVAAYFILTGCKTKEAIEKIKKQRKTIHLTKKQIDSLKRFELSLKKSEIKKEMFSE